MASGLPFNMQPAPIVRRASEPIDLGEFDETYAGWMIVLDMAVPLEANDIIAVAADASEKMGPRNKAVEDWLERVAIAWNFTDENGASLPQPRDGGAKLCPQTLIEPISLAIAKVIQPKKA